MSSRHPKQSFVRQTLVLMIVANGGLSEALRLGAPGPLMRARMMQAQKVLLNAAKHWPNPDLFKENKNQRYALKITKQWDKKVEKIPRELALVSLLAISQMAINDLSHKYKADDIETRMLNTALATLQPIYDEFDLHECQPALLYAKHMLHELYTLIGWEV